jgi:HlyD family secretion protein
MLAGRKQKIIAASAVLVIAVIWFLIARINAAKSEEPLIQTAKVEMGTVVTTVSASGVVQPWTTVDIKSNAGGTIQQLAVDIGDIVHPGQLIAKVDPTDSLTALQEGEADVSSSAAKVTQAQLTDVMERETDTLKVQQAEQDYASAKVKLEQATITAKAQPTLTRTTIQQDEANLRSAQETLKDLQIAGAPQGVAATKAAYDQAKSTLNTTSKNYKRQQELFKLGFISAGTLETAQEDYENAKATLDSAQAKLSTINMDYDEQIKTAQAKVDQAKAALDNARANSIQDKLRQQDVAVARLALSDATTALATAKSNLRNITIKAGDITTAKATHVHDQVALKYDKIQMGYVQIKAPRAGIILQKYVEVGTIVTSGKSSAIGTGVGTSIVQLGDISRVYVLAQVDEADIAQVENKQKVDVVLDAYPDEVFEGEVYKIYPLTTVTQNVTTIPVMVEITSPDARVKSGMNATCNFIVNRKEDVLSVPSQAIKEQDGKYTVTVMEHGKQVEKTVEIGIVGDDSTEITSGLKEGEDVITMIIDRKPKQATTGTAAPGGAALGGGGFGGGGRGR